MAPTATAIRVLPMSSVLRTTRTPTTSPRITSTDKHERDDVVPLPQLVERDEQPGTQCHGQNALADDQRPRDQRRMFGLAGGPDHHVVIVVLVDVLDLVERLAYGDVVVAAGPRTACRSTARRTAPARPPGSGLICSASPPTMGMRPDVVIWDALERRTGGA